MTHSYESPLLNGVLKITQPASRASFMFMCQNPIRAVCRVAFPHITCIFSTLSHTPIRPHEAAAAGGCRAPVILLPAETSYESCSHCSDTIWREAPTGTGTARQCAGSASLTRRSSRRAGSASTPAVPFKWGAHQLTPQAWCRTFVGTQRPSIRPAAGASAAGSLPASMRVGMRCYAPMQSVRCASLTPSLRNIPALRTSLASVSSSGSRCSTAAAMRGWHGSSRWWVMGGASGD